MSNMMQSLRNLPGIRTNTRDATPQRRSTTNNYSGNTYRSSTGGGAPSPQQLQRPETENSLMMRSTSMSYMPIPSGPRGERLHQIVVFELREDGATEYSSMTLRALYNYVVRTITEACRQANSERQNHPHHQHNNHRATINMSSSKQHQRGDRSLIYSRNDSEDGGLSDIGVIQEEVELSDSRDSVSPNPTTSYASPHNPTTPSNNINPPHLPSLTSSNANSTPPSSETDRTSLPTPITSNQSSDNHSPHDSNINEGMHHRQQSSNTRPQHQQRAVQTAFTPDTFSRSRQSSSREWCSPLPNAGNTHRERLGGYLHPRDMRRLVTPFSSSNEPQLMVRRHVMLLNFDPLRAIVLRDRLLVLVPDGADSILIALERRVRGGIAEMENQVFGRDSVTGSKLNNNLQEDGKRRSSDGSNDGVSAAHSDTNDNSTEHTASSDLSSNNNDEWEDIQKMDWDHMPYELQSVDAVLQTVTHMLMDDASTVHHKARVAMAELRGESSSGGQGVGALGEHAQERLRLHKDEVNLMEGRVQGFVRAMNEVLDDDEDMTLMNLSRLLTHPERFLQPVSQEILHEESDEPELILEAYLQQALSIVNELDLLKGQIMTTEEQISMTLDAIRNRLLYINTLLSVASLCVSLGSFIGSIFGMNLTNSIETNDTAFMKVTVGTIVGMAGMWGVLSWIFYRVANIHGDWRKKNV